MAQKGSALIRDPTLVTEDAVICDRIRADLQQCIEDCRTAEASARDTGFKRALRSVAQSCEAGIKALEKHLEAETGMEPEAQVRPTGQQASSEGRKDAVARILHEEKGTGEEWRPGEPGPTDD